MDLRSAVDELRLIGVMLRTYAATQPKPKKFTFFGPPVFEDNNNNNSGDDHSSSSLPRISSAQLASIADKVEAVMEHLRSAVTEEASFSHSAGQPESEQLLLSSSLTRSSIGLLDSQLLQSNINKNGNTAATTTATSPKNRVPLPPLDKAQQHQQAQHARTARHGSSACTAAVVVAAAGTARGTGGTAEQQPLQHSGDHRKLFPKPAPGWTRRAEPSVIARYAAEAADAYKRTSIVDPAQLQGGSCVSTLVKDSNALTSARGNNHDQALTTTQQPQKPHAAPLFKSTPSVAKQLAAVPDMSARHAMERQELIQASAASVYMVLRAAAHALRAESASIFVYFGGEMICTACVGAGAVFPPCATRYASGGSLAHAVLSSGVALHRTVRQDPKQHTASAGAVTVDVRGRRRSNAQHLEQLEAQRTSSVTATAALASRGDDLLSGARSHKVLPVQDTMLYPVFLPYGQSAASLSHQEAPATSIGPKPSSSRTASPLRQPSMSNATNNNNNNNNANVRNVRRVSIVAGSDDCHADDDRDDHDKASSAAKRRKSSTSVGGGGGHTVGTSSSSDADIAAQKFCCRAILQIQNKNRGTAAFTEADEARAAFFSDVLGYVMHLGDCGKLDYRTTSYDPIAITKMVPFVPASAMPLMNADECYVDHTFLSAVPVRDKNTLTRHFEDFEPRRLIHRSVVDSTRDGSEAGTGVARRAILGLAANEVGPAPSLREIDQYVSNLRDTWRRAVNETVASNSESTARASQVRELKTELERSRGEAVQLAHLLQLERFSAGDYVQHYEALKGELDGFLEQRANGLGGGELYSWTQERRAAKEQQQEKEDAAEKAAKHSH